MHACRCVYAYLKVRKKSSADVQYSRSMYAIISLWNGRHLRHAYFHFEMHEPESHICDAREIMHVWCAIESTIGAHNKESGGQQAEQPNSKQSYEFPIVPRILQLISGSRKLYLSSKKNFRASREN